MPRPPKPPDQRQGHRTKAELARGRVVIPTEREGADVVPVPPTGLLRATKAIWKSFFDSPVSRAVDVRSDAYRLERWIRYVDEWNRAHRVFTKERLVKGSAGQPVMNPLIAYLAQLEGEIARCEEAFGMTPAARARLGLTIGQERLTVEHLNRMLDAPASSEPAVENEWEEA